MDDFNNNPENKVDLTKSNDNNEFKVDLTKGDTNNEPDVNVYRDEQPDGLSGTSNAQQQQYQQDQFAQQQQYQQDQFAQQQYQQDQFTQQQQYQQDQFAQQQQYQQDQFSQQQQYQQDQFTQQQQYQQDQFTQQQQQGFPNLSHVDTTIPPNMYNQYNQNMQPNDINYTAIGSLVCGILSLLTCCCSWISIAFGVVAVILGFVSKKPNQNMSGLAIAGIITGGIGVLMGVGLVIVSKLSRFQSYKSFMDAFESAAIFTK